VLLCPHAETVAQAGITEHATMYPVDSIKVCPTSPPVLTRTLAHAAQTRMQVLQSSPAAVYTGLGDAFARISSTEGARALWRGVGSVIAGAGPAHAVQFGTYETVKELAGGNRGGSQFLATGASRGAGLVRARGADGAQRSRARPRRSRATR
jgi:solute carrier family 25 iron transporter 28/37